MLWTLVYDGIYIAGNNNFKVEDILDLVHEKQKKPASNPFAGKSS
jgi:hypothetical protein